MFVLCIDVCHSALKRIVLIVRGKHKDRIAQLISIDQKSFSASVRVLSSNTETVCNVKFNDICKLCKSRAKPYTKALKKEKAKNRHKKHTKHKS